jgi:hypothetical protein
VEIINKYKETIELEYIGKKIYIAGYVLEKGELGSLPKIIWEKNIKYYSKYWKPISN